MANRFKPGDVVRRIPGREIAGVTRFLVVSDDSYSRPPDDTRSVKLQYLDGEQAGYREGRFAKWLELDPFMTAVHQRRNHGK